VNLVTDKIYVANGSSSNVTVIDGATNDTTLVAAGYGPYALAVNPVTSKTYVANLSGNSVTVIDGATNSTTTVAAGLNPRAVAVDPVTNKIYVANEDGGTVTVITDAPTNDTKVRTAFDRLPGDTATTARPALTGKGVNRSTPGRTAMMGVCNRTNTAQAAWDWANITSGAGTDSIAWTYAWGSDSLMLGENLVCAQPLESDAGTTNNEGMGTPFAGNLEVYPLYRMVAHGGIEGERREPGVGTLSLAVAPNPCPGKAGITYSLPGPGNVSLKLYDVAGKLVRTIATGGQMAGTHHLPLNANGKQGTLASGIYILSLESEGNRATRKLVFE
jgi:YVTN family beta-propeller protein